MPVFTPGLPAIRCAILWYQRQADGRYFDSTVVPDAQSQLIEPPVATVPAARAAPPELGVMSMLLPPAADWYVMVITPLELLTLRDDTFAVDVGWVHPELRSDEPEAAFSETASFADPAIARPSATRVRTM